MNQPESADGQVGLARVVELPKLGIAVRNKTRRYLRLVRLGRVERHEVVQDLAVSQADAIFQDSPFELGEFRLGAVA